MSRSQSTPKQVIQVGNQQVSLPEGVTALDWGLERINYQNPRIRAFLGCIRLLGLGRVGAFRDGGGSIDGE